MAQSITEQVVTIERALGERMLECALVVIRAWMGELGENNPYEEAHNAIRTRYNELFSLWLTSNEEEIEEELNSLTGDAYQLADAVYADLRLKRGYVPKIDSFDPESTQSIIGYFTHAAHYRDEDLEWYRTVMNEEGHASAALLATAAMARGLRENFSIDAMMALIDGMNGQNETVADQCIANVVMLLIHYDVRIDFFPQIQKAFLDTISEMGDNGDHVFQVICALIGSSNRNKMSVGGEVITPDNAPPELKKLFESDGMEDEISSVQWMPSSESEYIIGLLQALPQTWLYEVLVIGNESREKTLVRVCIKSGYHEMLWEHPEVAETEYRKILRKGSKNPVDYINYAHCLMLKGDRMMAYENYQQARSMCKKVKDFYSLFRPDRGALVDKGVPLEHVYLIEDQLFNG
ncbi:MAG: hypothetical protein J5884_00435 [Paludibacteraceae bacterium]|nr:hypothetical protein [Paludibacteraceae bacterium]